MEQSGLGGYDGLGQTICEQWVSIEDSYAHVEHAVTLLEERIEK